MVSGSVKGTQRDYRTHLPGSPTDDGHLFRAGFLADRGHQVLADA